MQDFLQREIDTVVTNYKLKAIATGIPVTEKEELIMRTGIQFGFAIASKALCNLPIDKNLK